jgi:hypothetical protein
MPAFDLSADGYTINPIYMETFTGRRFDPTLMVVDDVCIEDIAHALALQNRYNGHSKGPISVARHSLWVCHEVELSCAHDRVLALTGLLHDAAEAYLGDIIRPLKHRPWAVGYLEMEEQVEQVIALKFRIPFPMPEEIKAADVTVTATHEREERRRYNGCWQLDEEHFLQRYDTLKGWT